MNSHVVANLARGVAVLVVALTASLAEAAAAPSPLIPRQAFFAGEGRSGAQISPDGRLIAFLAPLDGVSNIWVAPRGDLGEARAVTHEKARPIQRLYWAPNSAQVLFLRDQGGAEDFHLIGADVTTSRVVDYTPFENISARLLKLSTNGGDAVVVGLNNRNGLWHDVYRLSLSSGALTLIWRNPDRYSDVLVDREFNVVMGVRPAPDGGNIVDRIGAGGGAVKLFDVPFEASQTTALVSMAPDGRTLYLLDSRGRNSTVLETLDTRTGAIRVLGADERVDVASNSDGGVGGDGTLILDPRTDAVVGYGVNHLTLTWKGLDKATRADIATLDEAAKGTWSVESQSADNRFWTVLVDRVTEPPSDYLYDRQTRTVTKLFSTRPELDGARLAPMRPLALRSRDGFTLVSYLTLPPGTLTDAAGRPVRPLPLVLYVHGGPDERDVYGFNPTHQWLANRGYAVLSVNFRASTGFGKAFVNAGNLAWRGAMSDDLIDAVHWAQANGIAKPGAVAIYGGSYGGYAVLAGLTRPADGYACGVDLFGPSNLIDLMQIDSLPADWRPNYAQLVRRWGDPRTPDGRAYLVDASPITHVDAVTRPLLVAQGRNDPRIHMAQSDLLVNTLRARGRSVTYVNFPDEGHGFIRRENMLAMAAVAESFLGVCLGGRVEKIGRDLVGSSLQVSAGGDLVPGLSDAVNSAR
ncbi:S9 family peptidase [Caulobacter sp. CCUG 60055]|nr:S9 family peptidase [Caulobacter sp. CCUG 60055]